MNKVIETETSIDSGIVSTPNSQTTVSYYQTLVNIVYFAFGILEVGLLFRFLLKISGANILSGFVNFIYSVTYIFVRPFEGIFSKSTTSGAEVNAIFEPSTLMALIVYGVLSVGIVKLILILSREQKEVIVTE